MLKKILMASMASVLLQLAACRCTNANVIYDVSSGEKIYIETESSGWIEIIAFVDKEKKTFTTLQCLGGNSKQKERTLRMKTYDIRGKMLTQRILPFDFYYDVNAEYSFSPDGEKIVYHDEKSKSLHLYNIKTGINIPLGPDIGKYSGAIKKLMFINDKEYIVFLNEDLELGRIGDQMVLGNIQNKTYTIFKGKLEESSRYSDAAISSNHKTIAIPWGLVTNDVAFLSLSDFNVRTVRFPNLSYVQALAWNGNDELAVAGWGINLYHLKTGKIEPVLPMEKGDRFIVGDLFFIDKDKLLSIGWKAKDSGNVEECTLIDLKKKEPVEHFSLMSRNWKQIDDHTLLYDTICWFWF